VATRRRYKSDPPAVDNVAAPGPPAAPEPAPEGDDVSPLQRALEAQSHAEELQRQHAQRQQIGLPEPPIDPTERQAIDAHIDGIDGLSDHKRRFLKSHPSLLTEPYKRSMAHAYHLALYAGVADDTVAMDHAILSGVAKDIEHHRALSALTSADARPTPENAQMHEDAGQGADELMREAEEHQRSWMAENPPPAPPQKRRSIPMSAPVSRDGPSYSGQRIDAGKIHLTKDERQIAYASFPHMSKFQAEMAYAANRKRMHAMKADGSIQGDR
jgi:hypothetical protein